MARLLNRLALALVLLAAGNAWALGLGDITLDSALNEPLDAQIELLSATPEELADLSITLATAETFERYGLDRPAYLQGIEFDIIENGRDGSYVTIRSRLPVTEPFLTFLVEAAWSRGRLLREYTVFLDPPTFAPPQPAQQAVAAPERVTPRDSAPIQRPAPSVSAPATPAPDAASSPQPAPRAQASSPSEPAAAFSRETGGDYTVIRNETLWSIASRVRPDSRLTMNQTMLAIYQANPEAFAGNINLLKEGARLRMPSADEIFQIDRRDALNEVSRQHDRWDGGAGAASSESQSAAPEPILRPEPAAEVDDGVDDSSSLTLVPPDDDSLGLGVGGEDLLTEDPVAREGQILDRLEAIEAEDIPEDQALFDIRNDELARLRQELADIRGEVYEPPTEPLGADELDTDGGPFVDAEGDAADEPLTEEPAEQPAEPAEIVRAQPKASLVDQVIGALTSVWAIIAAVVVLVLGVLFWFIKRRNGSDDSGVFERLDDDDLSMTPDDTARTQTIPPPDQAGQTIVVEESRGSMSAGHDDTVEVAAASSSDFDFSADDDTQESAVEEFTSLEDTFSGETAVNLDQSDPIAEADFHMAYGLYDQAADLVNGALEAQPKDKALLTKLCEIYFVWGNRDSFVDAATRMKAATGSAESADWDKIVIMGQQIAADSSLFAGAGVAGATKEVDLTFDAGDDGGGDLDMVFGDEDSAGSDDDGLDFMFDGDVASTVDEDLEVTAQTPTLDAAFGDATAEMPAVDPGDTDSTAAMTTLTDDALGDAITESGQDADATAEIDLDDLGLDLTGLDDDSFAEESGETGRNPAIDPSATGVRQALDVRLDDDDDEIDLLAATGKTQILPDEMKVETINEPNPLIGDDAETMLASLDDDDDDDLAGDTAALTDEDATMLAPNPINEDFDYAKTEALPGDAFDADATAESPALASTDMDLDLDDLTAALDLSQGGDTVEMDRDDATVEQPRPKLDEPTAEVPTMSFGLDEMGDDLNEARTMTEVGTKLDLARAYVDMGDPGGARSILEEVLDEGDDEQRQQAQELLDALPG